MRAQGEGGGCRPRRGAPGEPTLPTPSSQTPASRAVRKQVSAVEATQPLVLVTAAELSETPENDLKGEGD